MRMDVREKLVEIVKKAAYSSLPSNTEDFHLNMFVTNLLSNGVTVQEWIPVTERLPEVRVPVLTYGRKGAVGIGFTQPTSVTADGKVYFYARYGDSLPTHWQPLPEPPKGERKEGAYNG